MPQLSQIESFAGQIFWLVISFVVLMIILTKVIMPRLASIIDARARKISEDLQMARLDNGKAEKILLEIEDKLTASRQQARDILAKAHASEAERLTAAIAKIDHEIRQETNKALGEIEAFKQEVRANLTDIVSELAQEIVQKSGGRKATNQQLVSVVTKQLAAQSKAS